MSERKVLNKYYPPDFDPSKVPRVKRKSKKTDVRTMVPFNMRCTSCGQYIACATKFNMRKEAVQDETYNNLTIYRFYMRCPGCLGTIILRTNPRDAGYEVESGATENFKAAKVAEKQAQEEAKAEEDEEKINPMKNLEERTKKSKQQMEAGEQIQDLRSIKYKFNTVDIDSIIRAKRKEISDEGTSQQLAIEDVEIRNQAKKMLKDRATIPPKPSCSSKIVISSMEKLKKKINVARR